MARKKKNKNENVASDADKVAEWLKTNTITQLDRNAKGLTEETKSYWGRGRRKTQVLPKAEEPAAE